MITQTDATSALGSSAGTTSPNTLEDNVGYLMFGAAGLVVSVGFVMSLLMRRR